MRMLSSRGIISAFDEVALKALRAIRSGVLKQLTINLYKIYRMIWGISTVGRTSLPYFIPKTVKVGQTVNGESAQNLPRKFGALAQLVARNVRIVEVRGSNPLRSTTSLLVLQ